MCVRSPSQDEAMQQYADVVFPLERCTFCQTLSVWCPSQSEKLLTAWYGRSWRTGYRLGRSSHASDKGMSNKQLAKGVKWG